MQEIFKITPHEKQVMMFSATLSKEIRPVCRKFMQDVSCECSVSTASFSCSQDFLIPYVAIQQVKFIGIFFFVPAANGSVCG